MKTLFIADPIQKLHPLSDTSLVLLRRALKLRHQVYWATDQDIEYEKGSVYVGAQEALECDPDALPQTGKKERFEIGKFSLAFIRKDPPFNAEYVRLCWLLSLGEKTTNFYNLPSLLLRYHEKLVPLEAFAEGYLKRQDLIPTHVGSYSSAKDFVRKLGVAEIIIKPFLGFGGRDIVRMKAEEFLSAARSHEDLIVQPFKAEVEEGDHRVFFLNGKILGSFARIPKEGHFVSNLAAGGSARGVFLAKGQKKVMEKVGKFLRAKKVFFAGADLIGELVSEVNITSPTGFRAFEKLYGEDLSEKFFKEALKCRKK